MRRMSRDIEDITDSLFDCSTWIGFPRDTKCFSAAFWSFEPCRWLLNGCMRHEALPSEDAAEGYYDCLRRIERLTQCTRNVSSGTKRCVKCH